MVEGGNTIGYAILGQLAELQRREVSGCDASMDDRMVQ